MKTLSIEKYYCLLYFLMVIRNGSLRSRKKKKVDSCILKEMVIRNLVELVVFRESLKVGCILGIGSRSSFAGILVEY